nr:hypothetical protein [Nitrosomonas nitrosa]
MTSGWRQLAFLLLAVGAGCAAPALFNPPDATFARHGPCAELEGRQLTPGSSCRTLINARNPANDAGVSVKEGERYRVCVAKGHTWKDASMENYPPCGSEGTTSMNMIASWRRSPESDWFALMAEVSGNSEQIDLCRSQEFQTARAGQLILYANDVPMFYWNNSGVIEVLITHLDDKHE